MGQDDFAFMDAVALAGLVRRKEVTPLELVDAAIARIERLNPSINAVITPIFDQARAAVAAPLPEGPFTGVPFLLKDLLGTIGGVRQASGSRFLQHIVPPEDSELVARFKRSGLVTLGKTNTPEFGLLPTTEPALFGPTRNPWDTTRSSGGSSGGSAAAVASGMVPMAHGNDGGGSIRIPASACGLFGLKPTRARTPLGPMLGDVMSGLAIDHALTRSVRDSAVLLDAIAGPDAGDPYWAPPVARPFAAEVGADPGRLRIAFATTTPTGVRCHPACAAAVDEAARLCADLGHEVFEASPALDAETLVRCFLAVWSAGVVAIVDGYSLLLGRGPEDGELEPPTAALYQAGKAIDGGQYLMAVQGLQWTGRLVAQFFKTCDVWLTPTLTEPPVPLGTFDAPPDQAMQALDRAAELVPFTALFNATGQPAMSVPLHWSETGLPIGVQFAGRFGDEPTLFRLASQLEAARPWAGRRPAG